MVLPHPESDLSINLMVLGSEIIDVLRKQKTYIFAERVMREFLQRDQKRSHEHFFDALTFLYMLGMIEYQGYKIKLRKEDHAQQTLF
jgi:hypothetical protein